MKPDSIVDFTKIRVKNDKGSAASILGTVKMLDNIGDETKV